MIETLFWMVTFCVGLQISLEQGMILHPLYRFLDRKIQSKWLRKPLFDCVYCFASIWGTTVYWTIQIMGKNIYGYKPLVYWIILTFACVYVNGVLYHGIKHESK